MAGYDPLDITSVEHPHEDYVAGMEQPVSHFRLGLPAGHFDSLQSEVEKGVMEALALLATITSGTIVLRMCSAW
jgi:aspartyl-tRNA(Asn)/glutamyl-tRNA(Gln) amidotransferase subunit A